MKTKKTWEKLLGIFLAIALVVGMIPVAQLLMRDKDVQSNAGAALTAGSKIYIKPNNGWLQANAVIAVRSNNDQNNYITMTKVSGSDNVYVATLPVDTDSINISRHSGSPASGSNGWNWTDGWMSIESGKNMYTMNASDSVSTTPGGSWSVYSGSDVGGNVTTKSEGVFLVDTLMVDYLNNDVVRYPTSTNWESSYNDDAISGYNYINYAISSQGYTYPMYFGDLGKQQKRVGAYLFNNYSDNYWATLSNWYSAINVAPTNGSANADNYNAVIQGLVGKTLKNGNLTDPSTGNEMFYFNTNAQKLGAGDLSNNNVTKVYEGLNFPFKYRTDSNGVTYYSYYSDPDQSKAKGYDGHWAVYYDAASGDFVSSQNYSTDSNGNQGFYPLNNQGSNKDSVNNAFGVKFTIPFTVGIDGKIKTANGDQDVIFEFTGDDDVWVFIDDQLVLDMGGAHTMATGHINFADLTATVDNGFSIDAYGKSNFKTNYLNTSEKTWEGYSAALDTSYASAVRAKINSGKITTDFPTELKAKFQNEYATDTAEVHTLTMFYMERGLYDSNMSISFNMTPVPSGLSVSKDFNDADINAGIIDEINDAEKLNFDFTATAPSGSNVNFVSYDLIDSGNITTNTFAATNHVVINGVQNNVYAANFLNSAGQNAFVAGTAFTIVEQQSFIFQYSAAAWTVYNLSDGNKVELTGNGSTASFTMGTAGQKKAYNWNVNFKNTMKLGNLSVTKVSDTELASQTFNFEVLLDLDGTGSAFSSTGYDGLVYTLSDGTTGKTGANGTFSLKPGQTATFEGIPAGATYIVREILPQNPSFDTAYVGDTGSIVWDETVAATITNTTKALENVEKTIYIEAKGVNKSYDNTNYTIMYGNVEVELETVSIPTGLSITWSQGSGEIVVFTADENQAGKSFRVFYTGKLSTGEKVSGYLNVHTFIATDKTYVFDFGLQSIISATTDNGCGLFQGGIWEISNVGTSAAFGNLSGITADRKTAVTATAGSISADGEFGGQVTFKPTTLMDNVEMYEYTVKITADGQTFDASNPETGTTLTGYITVLPANTVYYEDEFVFDNELPDRTQSHDWTTNYGYDDAYNADMVNSNNSVTHLVNNATKSFTFTGTGFDIISVTAGNSGGMRVDVKAEDGTVKTYYVDNMYKNGTLYQVPVISVMDLEHGTYTVTITSLNGYDSVDGDGNVIPTTGGVFIDGIRIYNPLKDMGYTDPTDNYLSSEQNVTFTELRDMFMNGKLGLVTGTDFTTVDAKSVIENYTGADVKAGTTWADLYKSGPNNELYVPAGNGVKFNFTVSDLDNFTLQIGAKDVKSGTTTMRAFVKIGGNYIELNAVNLIKLSTATDMYYDLTAALKDKGIVAGTSYELVIWNGYSSTLLSDFISLTTVKCSSVTLN